MQEVWLRLARTGGGGIEDLRGWLTTVTGRICLDAMCRQGRGGAAVRARRRDAPKGGSGGLPDRSRGGCLLADSAGVALYPVMNALNPAERVSFVLHDVRRHHRDLDTSQRANLIRRERWVTWLLLAC
jgi:DNA-directed RNA polymerase specialized sigma24 family protein